MSNRRKTTVIAAALIALVLFLCGCDLHPQRNAINYDLTTLSVADQSKWVSRMTGAPYNYSEKKIKVVGRAESLFYEPTGQTYHFVIIAGADGLPCCEQSLEYITADNYYPDDGRQIEVTGVYTSYTELDIEYWYLSEAIVDRAD